MDYNMPLYSENLNEHMDWNGEMTPATRLAYHIHVKTGCSFKRAQETLERYTDWHDALAEMENSIGCSKTMVGHRVANGLNIIGLEATYEIKDSVVYLKAHSPDRKEYLFTASCIPTNKDCQFTIKRLLPQGKEVSLTISYPSVYDFKMKDFQCLLDE